jgi:ribosome modulation factor
MMMTLDYAAWKAGYSAGVAGAALHTCPHLIPSQQAWSWHAGFVEGKAWRLTRMATDEGE